MKGLLIKDFKLMKAQKSFFLVLAAISQIMALTSWDISFNIGFLGFAGSLFTLSSISYDEFDHGNSFLFSLPITRKTYVLEKYTLGFITGAASLLLGTAISTIAWAVKNTGLLHEIFITACTVFPAILVFLSVLLPFHLKFGGDKGRIAMISAMGFIFVLGVLLIRAAEFLNTDVYSIYNKIPQLSTLAYILLSLLLSLLAILISYRISLVIMNKKEF